MNVNRCTISGRNICRDTVEEWKGGKVKQWKSVVQSGSHAVRKSRRRLIFDLGSFFFDLILVLGSCYSSRVTGDFSGSRFCHVDFMQRLNNDEIIVY